MKRFIFAILIGTTMSAPALADGWDAAQKLQDSYSAAGQKAGSWRGGADDQGLDSVDSSYQGQQNPQNAAYNGDPRHNGRDPNIHRPYYTPHHIHRQNP